MKKAFLFSVALGAMIVLGGCANKNRTADTSASRAGLVDRGSVAPVGGGPAGPGRIQQRTQP
ncbi:MAG TPA: hypothetical protein VGF73_04850 [Chthoniobacterales bacterium]